MQTLDVLEGVPFQCAPEHAEIISSRLGGYHRRGDGQSVISRVVGHIRLTPKLLLRIRSAKARAASVLSWAGYVEPSLRSLGNLKALDNVGSTSDLGASLALAFCVRLRDALARSGLVRHYRRREEVTSVVRGRIDFAKLARSGGASCTLHCQSFQRLSDTPLNRLMAATLKRIERDQHMRRAAGIPFSSCQGFFDGVPRIVPDRFLKGQDPLTRLEREFEDCVALGRLLLGGGGLSEGVKSTGLGYLVNLEALFESTVTRAFKLAGIDCEAQKPLSYRRESGPGGAFRIDLFCPEINGQPIVIDAKFKKDISPGNLHQMVSYCVMTGARNAVFVLPAGHLANASSFILPTVLGELRVQIAELDVSGQSQSDWADNCERLVADVIKMTSLESGTTQG